MDTRAPRVDSVVAAQPTPSVVWCGRNVRRHVPVLRRIKSVAKIRDRARSGITSLPSSPHLRLPEQRPQLVQDVRRRRTVAVERLDPREPLEDGA